MSSINFNIRKRRRLPLACEKCRNRKVKCDRANPCGPCVKSGTECTYVYDERIPPTSPVSVGRFNYAFAVDSGAQLSHTPRGDIMSMAHVPSPPLQGLGASQAPSITETMVAGSLFTSIPPDTGEYVQQSLDDGESLYTKTETSSSMRGTFSKSRFYGLSHWINFSHQSRKILEVLQKQEHDECAGVQTTFAMCKNLGRQIKQQESMLQPCLGVTLDLLPSRATSDKLVHAYVRTFEGVLRILHVPSFRSQYERFWENSSSVESSFETTLLLVLAIGSTFASEEHRASRSSTLQWILTAQAWLTSPNEKDRLNLDGVRIHCLLLLARQTNSLNGDTVWLSAGSLLHAAMHVGLHIDPESHACPRLSMFDVECRRRLWATVLELALQSSMDCGALPLISADDYDCASPSNVDDEILQSYQQVNLDTSKGLSDKFTHSSMQVLLSRTLPVRLRIAKLVNSFKHGVSFQDVLALGEEFTAALRDCQLQLRNWRSPGSLPTAFQTNLFLLFTQRFMLALHNPFAIQARSDQTYYYSRKICLETSMSLLSAPRSQLRDEDFHRLQLQGTGAFRSVYAQAVHYMCGELVDQSEHESLGFTSPGSALMRREIRKEIETYVGLTLARVETGEKNIKGVVFFSCLLAQVDALQAGESEEAAIIKALKQNLDRCLAILRSKVDDLASASDFTLGQDAWLGLTMPDGSFDGSGAADLFTWT